MIVTLPKSSVGAGEGGWFVRCQKILHAEVLVKLSKNQDGVVVILLKKLKVLKTLPKSIIKRDGDIV